MEIYTKRTYKSISLWRINTKRTYKIYKFMKN